MITIITAVSMNNRKKEFQVCSAHGSHTFPFALLDVKPTPDNPIVELYVDKELASECFTYILKSGEMDSVTLDQVRWYNRDPQYMHDMLLYKLSVEAQKRVKESNLSKREIIRRLGTSPSQLYRILDTTYYGKTVDQILKLFHVLQCEVEVKVTPKTA
ncbi:MAG: hypothetical protein IFK94_09285 [Acidobacteria bacterium]|uniref:Uncharacterized protein n=1 Tax=Candidatus Polarisedimenticola svalbardensis TaxID=2886004 RepID=A0A8J6Y8P6_9BACT|nr:hypothetical protein [Candidatus Polarisedimenticola svalbardensis]